MFFLPVESSDISPKEALMARTIIELRLCVASAKQVLCSTEEKTITDNQEKEVGYKHQKLPFKKRRSGILTIQIANNSKSLRASLRCT